MGYTTEFKGQFDVDKKLTTKHRAYLEKFSATRRMKRDPKKAEQLPDPTREAVGLPIGEEGAYYVGVGGSFGQAEDDSIIDYNKAPGELQWDHGTPYGEYYAKNENRIKDGKCQPGLWCNWAPNEDGTAIEWNGAEKFYDYVPWIKYLINHFLSPWGYVLNGRVKWQGEDIDDRGEIVIKANEVETHQ